VVIDILKLIIASSPTIIMGIVIACILYLSLPVTYLTYIGIINPKYQYSDIIGHLFLLSSGLLIAYFLKNLWKQIKKIPSLLMRFVVFRRLKNKQAISLLKEINDQGNEVLKDPGVPHIQSIVSLPDDLAKTLNLPLTKTLYFLDNFLKYNFLVLDEETNGIFGLSEDGRKFLVKNFKGKLT